MAGTPGKNKIETGLRLSFDDSGAAARDLSSSMVPGSFGGPGWTFDEADMTGVSETFYNFLRDRAMNEITAKFYFDDTATTGAATVLIGQSLPSVTGIGTLTAQFGTGGAAPDTGDPEWDGEYVLLEAPVSMDGNRMVITARWKPTGSVAPAWGTVS